MLAPLLLVARESKKKKLLNGGDKMADGESLEMKLSRITDILAEGEGLVLTSSPSSSSAGTRLSSVLLYASHVSSNPSRLRVPPAHHRSRDILSSPMATEQCSRLRFDVFF